MPNPILDKIKNAFANGAANFTEKLGEALDRNITNKEEAIKAKTEQEKVFNDFHVSVLQEFTKISESEDKAITDRWKADMESDSWWSKNIRPLVIASLLGFWFLVIAFDSAIKERFEVKAEYIEATKYLMDLVFLAYFGGRTVEKFKTIHEGTKRK